MNWNKIWALVKPVVIVVVAFIGLLFTKVGSFASIVLIIIIILSFLFRGKSIVEGFKEIGKSIGGGGVKPPNKG